MNFTKIIIVLCFNLIFTACLVEPEESENPDLLGWWGPELPENPSKQEFFEYNCFGKGGVFHFLELGYRKYMGKDVLYQINWFEGTWNSNGDNLSLQYQKSGYVYSSDSLESDWKSKIEWEPENGSITVKFSVSDSQLSLTSGGESEAVQKAQEIDALKGVCDY